MTADRNYLPPLPPDPHPPWRPRVSTQIMLLVVTVSCLGFAYGGKHFHVFLAHRRDAETAQLLEAFGGKTRYMGDTHRAFCLEFQPTERVLQDDGMPLVAQLDTLEYVDLRRTAITDRGLQHLYDLPQLSCVRVDPYAISQVAIAELQRRKPQLRIEPNGFYPTSNVGGFRALCNAMQREHGPLWEGSFKARMPADALPYLGEIEHLTTLDLSESKLVDGGLVNLKHMPKLQILRLDRTKSSDQCLQYLIKRRQLRELHLRDTNITRSGIEYLHEQLPESCRVHWAAGQYRRGRFARWRDIFVRPPTAEWNCVEWFETSRDLVSLQIIDNRIEGLQVDELGNFFPNLHDLELYRVGITTSGTEKPAALDNLRFLRLKHCHPNERVLQFVAALPALEVLVLSDTTLTEAELAQLETAAKLVEIDLTDTFVSPAAVARFRKAVPSCAVLGK